MKNRLLTHASTTANVFWIGLGLILGLALISGTTSAAENDRDWAGMQAAKIAEVASTTGRVEASDGSKTRTLRRGDPVYAGERVSTANNASAGLWLDETLGQPEGSLAQIEANSRARFSRASDGGARVTLEQGAVRVVDPREGDAGPAIELVALDSETRMHGGDREARILTEKTGPYAVLCDWDEPMNVTRGGQTANAAPGGCVVGNAREPLFAAPAHGDRIPLLAGAPSVAAAGPPPVDPQALLNDPLPPVSAGPPGGGPPLFASNGGDRLVPGIGGPGGRPDLVCGTPGSPCGASPVVTNPPPPVVVLQQPPTTTPAPGF